jgi:hypothetical protein
MKKQKVLNLPVCLAAIVLAMATAPSAKAAVILRFGEVGSNVVATYSGTLNLAALTFVSGGNAGGSAAMRASDAIFVSVVTSGIGVADNYTGFTGPNSWGPGGAKFVSSSSGDRLIFEGPIATVPNTIAVTAGYVSGTSLAGTSTFNNQTIATLGITPGTYVYTWGKGETADSLTVTTDAATATPEPGSWLLLSLGVGGVFASVLRRRRSME